MASCKNDFLCTLQAITWQNSRGMKVMGLPMLRLNLKFWLPKFIFVSVFPLTFMQVYLWCDYLNWGTWEKIIESQHFFGNKRFWCCFCKRTNKIYGSTMQPLKILERFEPTWPLRRQSSNSWMLLVHLQKNLRIFCFQKLLWLDNLLPSALVRVVAL